MDCKTIRQRHIADEYRAGRLSAAEVEAYEHHYFECDQCFADLQFRDQVAGHLQRDGETLFAPEIAGEEPGTTPPAEVVRRPFNEWVDRTFGRRRAWAGGLAAAAALAVIVWLVILPGDQTARLRGIHEPVPHPFVPTELRSGPGSQEFGEAMALYTASRYRAAATELEQITTYAPDDGEVRFYLGVSLLLCGESREATRALEEAVRSTPGAALYRWYLAQAQLESGDVEAARSELRRLAVSGREYALEARSLLEKISEALRQ